MSDFIKVIKERRSIRGYLPKPISDEIINEIVDCGRLAPTARNVQPWLIGVVKDQKLREKIAEIAEYGKFIRESPVCFAVFCDRDEKYLLEDGCACTENIILACSAYKIGTCWVAGDKKPYVDDIRKVLNVPEKYTLISLISAGYPKGDEGKGASKKPLNEVVFFDKF